MIVAVIASELWTDGMNTNACYCADVEIWSGAG